MNPKAPHQAVITVNIEIMERLPDGQVSGRPVNKSSHLFTVRGINFKECQDNINKFLERCKNAQ